MFHALREDPVCFYRIRATSLVAVVLFCASTALGARVEAQEISSSATPEELAAAIARTMTVTSPILPPNSSITLHFGSHGNIVESRTIFKESNEFENAVTHSRDLQVQKTRYMCKAERLAYLKRGVVFHDIMSGPDATKSFEFVVDEKACATLAHPVTADAASLTNMTQDIAQRLNAEMSLQRQPGNSLLPRATVSHGIVQITTVGSSPAFATYLHQRGFEIRGKIQGWLCGRFGDAIQRGVQMRVVYTRQDGSSLFEFPVDNSTC